MATRDEVNPIPDDAPTPPTEDAVAEALGDEASRSILAACMERPRSVREVVDSTGLATATTYRHVHALEDAGLLVVERSAISEQGKRYDLYRSTLRTARLQVGPDGVQVSWDLDESVEDRLVRMWNDMRL